MISAGHPIPALPDLCGPTPVTAGDERETFVRAADGGITYASNRVDFASAGVSPAGSLAGTGLVRPSPERILRRAGAVGAAVAPAARPQPLGPSGGQCPGAQVRGVPDAGGHRRRLRRPGPGTATGTDRRVEHPRAPAPRAGHSAASTAHGSSSTPSPKRRSSTPAGAAAAATRRSNRGGSRPATNPPGSVNRTRRSPGRSRATATTTCPPPGSTRFHRSKARTGPRLVTEESEPVQDGKPVVESDLAATTVERLLPGESKKNDNPGHWPGQGRPPASHQRPARPGARRSTSPGCGRLRTPQGAQLRDRPTPASSRKLKGLRGEPEGPSMCCVVVGPRVRRSGSWRAELA
ncbi:hypothetical protein ABIA38_005544 [Embleya sp. AB8]